MSEKFAKLDVTIDDDIQCRALELYVRTELSEPSIEKFNLLAKDIGVDFDGICRAVGEAVLNEMILRALERKLNND